MSDDVISLPDIPLPQEAEAANSIDDTFKSAFKFCFIGSGQGGSRLAETFYKLGYRRVCAVNSTMADLAPIQLPVENKLAIADRGAGKDLVLGEQYAKAHKEDILDLMRRCFTTSFDRIIITIGAGGGTGAGSVETLIEVATEWAESCGIQKPGSTPKVGVVIALPQKSEGRKANKNAYATLKKLIKLSGTVISPLIVVDNQKIESIYPGVSISKFWETANTSICSLFHLFNLLASQESSLATFDVQDYSDLLSAGTMSLGATPLAVTPKDPTEISAAIRKNLNNNVLSGGFDLSTASKAGCIFVGGVDVLSQIPNEYLNHGFEGLTRMLGPNSVVHRGIYKGDKPNLAVYTVISGLGEPVLRLQELRTEAGLRDHDEL